MAQAGAHEANAHLFTIADERAADALEVHRLRIRHRAIEDDAILAGAILNTLWA